jgi:hypothetical protein
MRKNKLKGSILSINPNKHHILIVNWVLNGYMNIFQLNWIKKEKWWIFMQDLIDKFIIIFKGKCNHIKHGFKLFPSQFSISLIPLYLPLNFNLSHQYKIVNKSRESEIKREIEMKERDVVNWDGEHPIWLNMTWIIIIILLMERNDHFRWRI